MLVITYGLCIIIKCDSFTEKAYKTLSLPYTYTYVCKQHIILALVSVSVMYI